MWSAAVRVIRLRPPAPRGRAGERVCGGVDGWLVRRQVAFMMTVVPRSGMPSAESEWDECDICGYDAGGSCRTSGR